MRTRKRTKIRVIAEEIVKELAEIARASAAGVYCESFREYILKMIDQ